MDTLIIILMIDERESCLYSCGWKAKVAGTSKMESGTYGADPSIVPCLLFGLFVRYCSFSVQSRSTVWISWRTEHWRF